MAIPRLTFEEFIMLTDGYGHDAGHDPYNNNAADRLDFFAPRKTNESRSEFDANREIKKGVMWFLLEDPHCEFGNWELED